MLCRLHIEHELGQRPVQARQRAFHDREARACELAAQFKVEAQRLSQIDMVFHLEGKGRRLAARPFKRAPFAQLDIADLADAVRHALMGQVGHGQQQRLHVGLDLVEPGARDLQLGFGLADLRHDLAGVLAFGLELPNLPGQMVALALQLFGSDLQGFALSLQRLKRCCVKEDLRGFSGFKARDGRGQVFAEKVDV